MGDMSYLMKLAGEERITWAAGDFPLLIHGREGSGASYATVVLAAELVRAGQPVVWLCARPPAVVALQRELDLNKPAPVAGREVDGRSIKPLSHSQLVAVHGRADFLLRSLRALDDWAERYVIMKNIEETMTPATWAVLKDHPRLVCSGDVGRMKWGLPKESWRSTIAFSEWPSGWPIKNDPAPPYIATWRKDGKAAQKIIAIDRKVKNPKE